MAAGHRSILIVGAGTTGLTAALELARRGFRPRVVDAAAGPIPIVESRALGVNARTLTLLSPSRVTDAILQEACEIRQFRAVSKGKALFRHRYKRSAGSLYRHSRTGAGTY